MAYKTPQLMKKKIFILTQIFHCCLLLCHSDTYSKTISTSNKEHFIPFKSPQCFSVPFKQLHAFGNIFADYIALRTLMMVSSHWTDSSFWCPFLALFRTTSIFKIEEMKRLRRLDCQNCHWKTWKQSIEDSQLTKFLCFFSSTISLGFLKTENIGCCYPSLRKEEHFHFI